MYAASRGEKSCSILWHDAIRYQASLCQERSNTGLNQRKQWDWVPVHTMVSGNSPRDTWLTGCRSIFFLLLFRKTTFEDKWRMFLQVECSSCHQIHSLKALTQTREDHPRWSHFLLMHRPIPVEHPLRWLSDTSPDGCQSTLDKYIDPPYCRANMLTGRIACWPWWVTVSMPTGQRDGQTDRRTDVRPLH